MIPIWLLTPMFYLSIFDTTVVLTLVARCNLEAIVHDRERRGVRPSYSK